MGDTRSGGEGPRLRLLPGEAAGPAADPGGRHQDARVDAVLRVLAGEDLGAVATDVDVDRGLLHRWMRSFVAAGTAKVQHRPDPEVSRQRDRFLAAFADELRAPLAATQGWITMLAEGDVPPSHVEHTYARLEAAVSQLAARNRDVELLARASMGRLEVATSPVGTRRLLRSTVARHGAVDAGTASSRVLVEDGPHDIEIEVDEDVFGLVLRDLWAAAHLEPAPRLVRLTARLTGRWVELRVVREADPVPPDRLRALFDPFDLEDGQAEIAIGLYLARALTIAHGGTLGVDQDDDQAVFWVRVPRQRGRSDMVFKLACGDVMPGCPARFESSEKDALIGEVAEHARVAHGIEQLTPGVREAVEASIVTA